MHDFYEITGVSLEAQAAQRRYIGAGQFLYNPFVPSVGMSLELAMNNTDEFHFDGTAFMSADHDSMDIEVDRNDLECFDTVIRIVASRCQSDWDRDGVLAPRDVASFVLEWQHSLEQGTLDADYDASGAVDPADVAAFASGWLSGLSGGRCS